jgi:hypothetical protein
MAVYDRQPVRLGRRMNDPVVRSLPLPYAFDTAIGYWTGELDWERLAASLREAVPASELPEAALVAWVEAARAGDEAAPLVLPCMVLTRSGVELVVSGPEAAVDPLVAALAARLAG